MTLSCPSLTALSAFYRGEVHDDIAASIAEHLDACPSCLEAVAQLSTPDDEIFAQLRAKPLELVHCHEHCLTHVQGQLQGLMFTSLRTNHHASAPLELTRLGEYELLDVIGQGGMGLVYRARHKKLDRIVAVKVLPPERTRDSGAVARFEREMRAVAKLDHPHIVRALDAGELDDTHFLVMEFVDGINVAQVCERNGRLAIADACQIVCQAAHGLAVAHQHGIVHRDVKPSNLMLTNTIGADAAPQASVKILDLGLAMLSDFSTEFNDPVTASGQIMGTLDFMAPEQCIDSHHVDQRADIYALGATLYMMLIGEPPFPSQRYPSFGKRFQATTTEIPTPVRAKRPDVPRKLSQFIDRLLAKSPSVRPQTVQDVVKVLEPYCVDSDLAVLIRGDSFPVAKSTCETVSATHAESLATYKRRPRSDAGVTSRLLRRTAFGVLGIGFIIIGFMKLGTGWSPASSSKRDGGSSVTDTDHTLPESPEELRRSDAFRSLTGSSEPPPFAQAPFDASEARKHQQDWADYLGLPIEKDITLPDGTLLTFMLIPPGAFRMGADKTELATNREVARDLGILSDVVEFLQSQTPRHTVQLSRAFYMGKYEVTQQQWTALRPGNPSLFAGLPLHPVERVDFDAVQEFIAELNLKVPQENARFVLPTEAQWEFACRAGSETTWGSDETRADFTRVAWFTENSDDHSHAVGLLLPNAFGLYDMHGNVWEWCSDWYGRDYYQSLPAADPTGPASGELRIHRGGGYCDTPLQLQAAYREGTYPINSAQGHKGFRLALVFDAVPAAQSGHIDRDIARWILSRAGRVWTDQNPDVPVTSVPKLPQLPFKVVRVDVTSPYIGNNISRLTLLTSLTEFDTISRKCTSEIYPHLGQINTLQRIGLTHTAVTSDGIEHLQSLSQLSSLDLAFTAIDDEALRELKSIPSLRVLNLGSTSVTDSGLPHLHELPGLTDLYLDNTAVSDAGLTHLARCERLNKLNLVGSKVTPQGVADLQQALQDCQITTNWSSENTFQN